MGIVWYLELSSLVRTPLWRSKEYVEHDLHSREHKEILCKTAESCESSCVGAVMNPGGGPGGNFPPGGSKFPLGENLFHLPLIFCNFCPHHMNGSKHFPILCMTASHIWRAYFQSDLSPFKIVLIIVWLLGIDTRIRGIQPALPFSCV